MPPIPLGRTLFTPFRVTAPSGATLHGMVHRPIALPFRPRRRPAVVMLPGGMGSGRLMARGRTGTQLARAGMVVVSFNAEGRGKGLIDRRSGGTPDFNGFRDQDGLAAVVRHTLSLPDVDPDRLGLYSVSFGFVAAAGLVGRYPELPVRWIVDEEGPADAYSAMLKGWREHDLGERPDRAQKAIELFGHDVPTGPGPAAEFWGQREPVRFLRGFRGRYLRLQAEFDHVQPPQAPEHVALFDTERWWQGCHAVAVVNALVEGGSPWVGVNPAALGNPPNRTWSREAPPRWLPGSMADHPTVAADAVLTFAGLTSGGDP